MPDLDFRIEFTFQTPNEDINCVINFNYLATLAQTAAKEAVRRQEENAAKLSEAAAEKEQLKKEMVSSSVFFG